MSGQRIGPGPAPGALEGLHAELDAPLPGALWLSMPTAIFVCGWCFHHDARIAELSFILDGERHPVMAHGMPRLDPLRALHPTLEASALASSAGDPASLEDPALNSYASGFWGLVPVGPRASASPSLVLELEAELEDGRRTRARLGEIAVLDRPAPEAPAPAADGSSSPLIAIAMATHNPPRELFARQIESIRAQTHPAWLCVISDDCSRPEAFAAIDAVVDGDARFVVSRSPQRLGFYRNFERALAMVPRNARYVALADQDDRWYPDKLATLVSRVASARLIYSDARVVTGDGGVISDTYWSARRNNHDDLLSLLVANSVTGAASLFHRDLLDRALPFPPAQFAHYHDHWLALTALSEGEIEYVARPLYDYVQHGTATLGHAAANRMDSLRDRLRIRPGDRRARIRRWRLHYFADVCRLVQVAEILELRHGKRIAPDKRRVLRRFVAAERSPGAIAELWGRGIRELVGVRALGRRSETLGAEWMLFRALWWRRLLALSARERPQLHLRLDAAPPPDLAPPAARRTETAAVRGIRAKLAPLELAANDRAPRRINLLIPTIDLEHFFGGYIAKFNLARRLAENGCRVRIVTVDPVPPLPRDWRTTIEAYSGLGALFDDVELAFGRERAPLEVSPEDRFIASTWWTAHIAHAAAGELGDAPFLYLIQEYEPFTFPMGSYAALAADSYRLPHVGLFSSELLRDYFRAHRLGVFSAPSHGDARSWSFQNAITDVQPPPVDELAGRSTRKLLFYARPEPHAARNLFELGLLALTRALELGAFASGWEINGVGTVELPRQLDLGGGIGLNLLARSDQLAYARLLRDHDLGLALMYTPHPSLVPIEMAAAGMVTVTNSFENKTPGALAAISTNLIAAEPSVEALAEGLVAAERVTGDVDDRVQGSRVDWSRDWHQSLDDGLIGAIVATLTRR